MLEVVCGVMMDGVFVELVMEVVLARQSLWSPQCGGVLNVVVVVVNLFILV